MNSALAELLPLLTSAALQPSICSQSVAGAAYRLQILSRRFAGGRACTQLQGPTSQTTTVSLSNKKTARPEPVQARRSIKNSVVSAYGCDSVSCLASCFAARAYQKIRRFANTLFQFRKVHENLVGAQPARYGITRIFFCAVRIGSPYSTQSATSYRQLIAATPAQSRREARQLNSGEFFALQSAPYPTWVSLNRYGSGSIRCAAGCDSASAAASSSRAHDTLFSNSSRL